MIDFRCWYCNKRLRLADERAGERLVCTCRQRLRVPRKSGGSSRDKTLADRGIELLVYGGGGALLGLLLAIVILSRIRIVGFGESTWLLLVGLPALGFLLGAFGGERGVNWVGRVIRGREQG